MKLLETSPTGAEITFDFIDIIKHRRLELGVSQSVLSSITGINQSYISRLEKGNIKLTLETTARLCDALKLQIGLIDNLE